jgi:hypothetical protein
VTLVDPSTYLAPLPRISTQALCPPPGVLRDVRGMGGSGVRGAAGPAGGRRRDHAGPAGGRWRWCCMHSGAQGSEFPNGIDHSQHPPSEGTPPESAVAGTTAERQKKIVAESTDARVGGMLLPLDVNSSSFPWVHPEHSDAMNPKGVRVDWASFYASRAPRAPRAAVAGGGLVCGAAASGLGPARLGAEELEPEPEPELEQEPEPEPFGQVSR